MPLKPQLNHWKQSKNYKDKLDPKWNQSASTLTGAKLAEKPSATHVKLSMGVVNVM